MQRRKRQVIWYGIMYGAGFVVSVSLIPVALMFVDNAAERWFFVGCGVVFGGMSGFILADIIRRKDI